MTPQEWRRALAWAIVHANGKDAWQLEVYAVIGRLAMAPRAARKLRAAYEHIAGTGPCNWNWRPSPRDEKTLAILGREPARGEDVVATFNRWVGRPAAEWPDVLPVPEAAP